MKTTTISAAALVSLILGMTASTAALGADAPEQPQFPPWDRGALRLGGFVTTFDSTLAFGTTGGGTGINLDAEKMLGLDSSLTVIRADALYRIGESRRHRLDLSYAAFHRSGDATLTQEINIDGEILVPGTQIESVFNFDLYRLSYTYSFFMNERVNLGAGLGVYVAPVEYGVDITTPGDTRTLDVRDVTLPLPVLSLRSEVKLSQKFSLYGELDALYLELGGFAGSVLDLRVGLEYQPTKHFGLGVGFNSFNIDVESEGSSSDYPSVDFIGAINVKFRGLLLYGKLSF